MVSSLSFKTKKNSKIMAELKKNAALVNSANNELFMSLRTGTFTSINVIYCYYVEIKCQLDATDDFYCRSYCLLNMFQAPFCPSSGAREYYKNHLLHLVGILLPHINDDARSKSLQSYLLHINMFILHKSVLCNT
jgi:hypothetical protein